MQSLYRALVLVLIVFCGGSNARSSQVNLSASKLPLYDAFHAFCADTGTEPARIQETVERAGAVQVTADSSDESALLSVQAWDVFVGGHKLTIMFGAIGYDQAQPPDAITCTVESSANETQSVAEIRKWVAPVRPWRQSEQLTNWAYLQFGEKRKTIAPTPVTQDGRWDLSVFSDSKSALVTLRHTLHAHFGG